ncbi:MAG TPA: ABC transporter, partial [Acidimicrobiaceae bacterium]|nr:ABC transporter [Acidimicrobiaceae bacterium]
MVDPQKYADAALHEQYLRRFAGHAAVTIVVLNQVDLVPEQGRQGIFDDLARLLEADGLHRVRVVATSTTTGEGVDALRRELAARTAERRALVARLDADVDWLADQLAGRVGDRAPE